MAMRLTINLNIKWNGDEVIVSSPITEPEKPPVIDPPQENEVDITKLWYDTFSQGHGELILESGKTYSISTVQTQKINGKVRIKSSGQEPANLWIGKENYILYVDKGEDTFLFLLDNGAEVLIENINASIRPQKRNVQQMYSVNWFTSVQNENAKWTAILKDIDTTKLGRNGGLGTGIVYGGKHENHIALINYKHSGPMIMELKNPYPESVMYFTGQNVWTDYKDPNDWSKRAHLTTGKISKDHVLSLTGDVETTALYNHFFLVDKGANRSFLAHIGRFTFIIDTIDSEIDRKHLQLRPRPQAGEQVYVKGGRFFFKDREAHVLDSFGVNGKTYTIREKLKTENNEWTNNFGQGDSPETVKALQNFVNEAVDLADGFYKLDFYNPTFNLYDQDQPIYLIYKDDLNFRTTESTEFGDWQVLQARGGAHIAYNHRQISIWAENVHLEGYYRESTKGEGITLGYNMVNCTGFDDEFSQKEITTNKPIPEQIKQLLQ